MKVLIADDHPLFRTAIKIELTELAENIEIVEAFDIASMLGILAENSDFDLLLIDLQMPSGKSFDAISHIRARFPCIPVVVLSASEAHLDVQTSLDCGAIGYIPKSFQPSRILSSLRFILDGGCYVPPELLSPNPTQEFNATDQQNNRTQEAQKLTGLTERELEVLSFMHIGHSNKELARDLGLALGTVKIHVASVMRKLGVSNRTQAALFYEKYKN